MLSQSLRLEGRQTARQKQKALRGIRSSSFLAEMGLNVEDAQHGQLDATLAQVQSQQIMQSQNYSARSKVSTHQQELNLTSILEPSLTELHVPLRQHSTLCMHSCEMACLCQDVGTGQMAHGKHQMLSSFWTQHIQRAARAELALRINKAHKDAEREQSLKWHTLRVGIACA